MGRKIDSAAEYLSGTSSCNHPRAIGWQGQRHLTKAIIAEWRIPIKNHYRLLVTGNLILKSLLNGKENIRKVKRIIFENIE